MPRQLDFNPGALYSEDLVDGFGRARGSQPTHVNDTYFTYDLNPLTFTTALVGGATITKSATESSASLSVTSASGDSAVLQTKAYHRYQPGKSQLIMISGFLASPHANSVSEIGYNDDQDGVFFRQANGMNVVIRSSTSGSVVDTVIPQAQWNIDKMDGTGLSVLNIDFTKSQLFVIDFEWLGTGRIRFGLNVLGRMYYFHESLFTNALSSPYTNTPNLPVRWKLYNTGAAAVNTMKAQCFAVISEGGLELQPGLNFGADSGITPITVTTRRPVLSIQLAPTFNGILNRQQVTLNDLELTCGEGSILWEAVLNPTLTGASFSAVDTNSCVNKDTSATALSGGIKLVAGYVTGDNGGGGGDSARGRISKDLSKLHSLYNNFDGTTGDILTISARAFTGTSPLVTAAINWDEIR